MEKESPALRGAVSVIIPALDEEGALGSLLGDLSRQKGIRIQVIVADGGSGDGTRAVFDGFPDENFLWVDAPRGRGAQMNAGAKAALFEDLLFLHADTRIPDENLLARGFAAMERECGGSHRALGHFTTGFCDGPRDFTSFFLTAKTTQNLPECVNGDQGFWLRKGFFSELGGFDASLPYLEDLRLARLAFSKGRIALLPGKLMTSSRRFCAEGPGKRLLLNALIRFAHEAGAKDFYGKAGILYKEQSKTGKLKITPFFTALWSEGKGGGWWRFTRKLWGFGADNSWQVSFWLDARRAFRRGDEEPVGLAAKPGRPILRVISGDFVVFFFFAALLAGKIIEPESRKQPP